MKIVISQTLLFLLLLSACRKDQIAVYEVGKETEPLPSMVSAGPGPEAPGNFTPQVTWKTPAGWQEKPGAGMRFASFVVPGAGSGTGDMSITVLEGDAGGALSNVNRWREQIGLAPLTMRELGEQSEKVQPGGREMILIDFASGEGKGRVLAAIYPASERTWFFKLIGDDATVGSAKKSFVRFLESLEGL